MSEPITAAKIIAALVRETDDHGMTRIQLGEVHAIAAELDRLRAENEALRADARRWQTVAPMFQGWSLRMDGTAHWVLHGGAIKPRARTVAEAVDAMAPNAELAAPHSK